MDGSNTETEVYTAVEDLTGDDDEIKKEEDQEQSNGGGAGGNDSEEPPNTPGDQKQKQNKFKRNNRYGSAYGSYNGGYGPHGGYGPPGFGPAGPGFGPRGRGFGPQGPGFGPPGPGFGPQGPGFGYQGPGDMPPPLMGNGYGPMGPPNFRGRNPDEIEARKYLMRCGMSRDIVKALPVEYLMNIQPHYCGVCCMDFETFSISRLHYGSKNHMKNQNRWVSQFKSFRYGGPREPPLKSRELYCELCDVQITSQVHAASHYAGRPHRAIVEGRRGPKNPLLVKPGNEARLHQLIRREKRHLKNQPEPETKPTEQEKPIPPELTCDICNTFMTNQEQMTMHLNGKKHLNKEKQHILKMMQGGDKANKAKAPPQAETPMDISEDITEPASESFEGGEGMAGEENSSQPEQDPAVEEWQNGTGEDW